MCLWARLDNAASFDGSAIFSYGDVDEAAGDFSLRVSETSDTFVIQLWGDGDNWGNNKEVKIEGTAAGGWHHYCLNYENNWQLYFDGELVSSGTPTLPLATGTDYALRLGAWGASAFFAGSIDELYVYLSRVLLKDATFRSTRGDQVSDGPRRGRSQEALRRVRRHALADALQRRVHRGALFPRGNLVKCVSAGGRRPQPRHDRRGRIGLQGFWRIDHKGLGRKRCVCLGRRRRLLGTLEL